MAHAVRRQTRPHGKHNFDLKPGPSVTGIRTHTQALHVAVLATRDAAVQWLLNKGVSFDIFADLTSEHSVYSIILNWKCRYF